MKLTDLVESKVRFFLDDDLVEPMPRKDGKPHKAHLVKGKNGELWIPKSTTKEIDIVDENTGEVVGSGYWVSEYWRNKDLVKVKTIRMSKIDYKDMPKKPKYITI